ncbi:vacuolar protein sorting-associated protein VTA1 homolog [Diorhabda carinulata]|uniref:vacuolar protein sorting-associated protein VTA1 homolog n=1 Tax=Diorhabda carinulata TaxID=1163345 RepID=UPI0025A04700|nr:vacuolar protein sorting-associated protein VTA1 homolog [Diorhabda carinulata]
MVKFPPVPAEVKPIAHLLKLADEHDERNIVIAYWARMAACLLALQLVPTKKSPQTAELIRSLLDWLEQVKKANADNEGITSDTIAQSLIEEYALRLFNYADHQDREQIFNKNTIKTFYKAGILMDVLDQFGPLPDDIREKRKYAKWKAAYIHNCLKAGDTPLPGPPRPFNSQEDDGIVHNSQLTDEELATFTKYTGPVNFDEARKPKVDTSPPPDDLIPFNPPKPLLPPDNSNFNPAPAPSPVTPQIPTNTLPSDTPQDPSPFDSTPSIPSSSQVSTPASISTPPVKPTPTGYIPTPEVIQKAQKYSKFATSALNYDDTKNAIDYLQKAMNLLQFGKEE